MKAIVCVKQVPDTSGKVAVKPDGTMDRAAMATITNPDDLAAVEAALELKDATGCQVIVVSMGPPPAEGMLRELLARGCDRAVLVSGREFGGSDTFATSQILAAAVNKIGLEKDDIVFCGRQAIDGDTGQVGPEMAEHLGYTQITYATELVACEGDKVQVRKETADGYDVLEAALPVVISVTKTPFELRYPTVKKRLAANRTQIPTITPQDMEGQIDLSRAGLKGSPTKVKKSFTPQHNKTCVVVEEDSPSASAVKLVALLSDDKKI